MPRFDGTPTAERIDGTDDSDLLFGSGGDDVLVGRLGDDYIYGQGGDDVIYGGFSVWGDSLFGGSGNDTIIDDSGDFFGGEGDDTFRAVRILRDGSQDQYLYTTTDARQEGLFDGGAGEDRVVVPFSFDDAEYYLVNGSSRLIMFTYDTWGAGPSEPFKYSPSVAVENVEFIEFSDGVRRYSDVVGLLNDTLLGTAGADTLDGASGDDVIRGFAGDDDLTSGDGLDTMLGGAGDDRLEATLLGDKVLYGDDGNDQLIAHRSDATLYGGRGRDELYDQPPSIRSLKPIEETHTLHGGLGDDQYFVSRATTVVTGEVGYSQGGGIDTIWTSIAMTLPQNVEALRMADDFEGERVLFGNFAPNVLVGDITSDTLNGGRGDDRIVAGGGNDLLVGGLGRDTLVGGHGRDAFLYNSVWESRPGQDRRDVINGLDTGRDIIDLASIDANWQLAGNQAYSFSDMGTFSGQAGELIWNAYGGNWSIVSADNDGDRQVDFQLFVNLTPVLTEADFIL